MQFIWSVGLAVVVAMVAAEAQNREEAQKAFEEGYKYQMGRGVPRNLQRAQEAYRRVLSLDPKYVDAYYNLAQVFYDINRFDLAERFFKRYLDFRPGDAEATHDLGVVYNKQARFDLAIRQYKRALELNPKMAVAHYNLGNIYYSQKQEDLASREWQRAIDLDPNNEAFISKVLTVARIKERKQSVLSPSVVAWSLRIFGGALMAYFIYYTIRRKRMRGR